jgi:hypothetical protein
VGPPPGLPDGERLVRVRRPADVGHGDLPPRVSEDPQHGGRPRRRTTRPPAS